MPSPFTPTPTILPATITLPDDGDLEDVASVNVPSEVGLDAIAFLTVPAKTAGTQQKVASQDLNIAQRGQVWYDPAEWGQVTAKPSAVQLSGTATYISMDLQLPHGSTLKELDVFITPGGSHSGLPATMPSWTLYSRNMSTGADTSIISKVDTSATVLAYETYHVIRAFPAIVIDRAKRYWVVMNGEGSTNALAGLVFQGIVTVCTVTEQDVGAS